MTNAAQRNEVVKALLAGLSDLEVRELSIAALQAWEAETKPLAEFNLHGDFALRFLPLLQARKKQFTGDVMSLTECFADAALSEEWMAPVVEFMHWFATAGFAVPLLHNAVDTRYPFQFRLTARGREFLRTVDEHPFHPARVVRTSERCPGLPREVLELLEDAQACMDRMLLRAGVLIIGIAYETVIERVAQDLVLAKDIPPKTLDENAAKRVGALREHVRQRLMKKKDNAWYQAEAALDFADRLRSRRNDAAHTRQAYGFQDRGEVEELLVSAFRHLPGLWGLAIPTVADGT